jgi:hypothetical protein
VENGLPLTGSTAGSLCRRSSIGSSPSCAASSSLARRPHRAGRRQVEPDQVGAEPPVLARIQWQRAERNRFEETRIVVLRGDAFMREGGNTAIGGGADPHALRRRRAVMDQIGCLRAGQGDLHRPADPFRGDRREDHLRPHPGLAAEAAADERRQHTHILLGNAKRLSDRSAGAADHLVAGPHCQLSVGPFDNAGMRFERGGKMDGRRVAAVEHHRRVGQRLIDIADVDRGEEAQVMIALHRLLGGIEAARASLGMDDDQLCRLARHRLILGNDDRHRLAVMKDTIGAAVCLSLRIAAPGDHARIVVDNRDDPGQRLGSRGVDPGDTPATDRRPDDSGISGACRRTLVRIARRAADLCRPLDPRHRCAEHVLLRARQACGAIGPVHRHLVHRVGPRPERAG